MSESPPPARSAWRGRRSCRVRRGTASAGTGRQCRPGPGNTPTIRPISTPASRNDMCSSVAISTSAEKKTSTMMTVSDRRPLQAASIGRRVRRQRLRAHRGAEAVPACRFLTIEKSEGRPGKMPGAAAASGLFAQTHVVLALEHVHDAAHALRGRSACHAGTALPQPPSVTWP